MMATKYHAALPIEKPPLMKADPSKLPPISHEHGYDVILSGNTKQGLQCPECQYILKQAVQTSEGIRLCEPCYRYIARLDKFVSPRTGITVVGDNGQPVCFPDKAVRREVDQLECLCKNRTFGCDWCDRLSKYEAHLRECKFTPVQCPNTDCMKSVLKENLEKHLQSECDYRQILCKYCGEATRPIDLDDHHSICAELPVPCKHCSKNVPRNKMPDHNLNDCPTIECLCGALLKRNTPAKEKNSVDAHFATPSDYLYHLLLVTSKVDKWEHVSLNSERRLLALENGKVKSSEPVDKLAAVQTDLQKSLRHVIDRLIPLEQHQAEWQPSSKDKNLIAKVASLADKLKHFDEKNAQQDILIRTLQTQLQRGAITTSLNTTSETTTVVESSRMVNVEKRYEDLEKQVSMLKVHVSEIELQLQASLASTHNGSFLWRIPNVSRRRRDGVEERITSIYSPPFYTGRNGYKMCIRAYLNGDGMGYKTHLSLFFVLMKGEFDALLKWPFDYKVSLILVDQNHRKHIVQTFKPTPESNSFQRPVSEMNVASGCPQFAKLSVLDDDSYVKDDVLFVKCIVDTTRIFHP